MGTLMSHSSAEQASKLGVNLMILLMEEIPNNHLGYRKPWKKWDFNYQPQLVSLPDFWTIKQYQLPCNFSQSWTSFFRDSKLTNALLILLSPCEVSCEVNPKFPSSFASGNGIFVWVVCWRGPSGPLRNQSAPKKKGAKNGLVTRDP